MCVAGGRVSQSAGEHTTNQFYKETTMIDRWITYAVAERYVRRFHGARIWARNYSNVNEFGLYLRDDFNQTIAGIRLVSIT